MLFMFAKERRGCFWKTSSTSSIEEFDISLTLVLLNSLSGFALDSSVISLSLSEVVLELSVAAVA
jgi:hypothetical protein